MSAWPGRSPLGAYLAMAAAAVAVFLGLSLVSAPADRADDVDPTPPPLVSPPPPPDAGWFSTVLGRPRVVRDDRYCDERGCCPTLRTTFGTTAPAGEVIAAFEARGFLAAEAAARTDVKPGPWPDATWTAELDLAGRWRWRRVRVAGGSDVDRPAWPTVFTESSVACGAA
jgi:hypothetical protein